MLGALISLLAAVDSDLMVMPSIVQLSDNTQTVPLSVINQTKKTITLDPGVTATHPIKGYQCFNFCHCCF